MTEGDRLIKLGEARGEARGEAKGRAEGRTEGRAAALLAVLQARGFRGSKAVRQRVMACGDVATLDRWIARAATADSLRMVFDQ
jgi:predicted transposase YdaD